MIVCHTHHVLYKIDLICHVQRVSVGVMTNSQKTQQAIRHQTSLLSLQDSLKNNDTYHGTVLTDCFVWGFYFLFFCI